MKKMTFKQVRQMFWENAPEEWKKEYRVRKHQNDYNATIRSAFVNFTDSLCKGGQITQKQYEHITLG